MEIAEAVKRLAFIKYLYNVGVEQTRKPEPLCWISLLTFHDAVELFLELSLEYHGSSRRLKDMRFMQYWDELNPILNKKGKPELTQKISMERLNEARVAFKHHGTPPSKAAIDDFKANVTSFFEENTPIVFDVKFAGVALVELVKCETTKNYLKEAEELLKQGKIEDSLNRIALAFAQLIDDYESRKMDEFGRSPFFFGGKMHFLSSFFIGIKGKMGDFIDRTKESVEALQEAVKILSLGLDYKRYARFKLLIPHVDRYLDGKYKIVRIDRGSMGVPTVDDVNFCINFVIESALALQEFDFEVARIQKE
jgi:hypothetical protein